MTTPARTEQPWLPGVIDLATAAAEKGARQLERAHLSIADESFNVLARIPVTRPISEPVREIHHRITRISYRSVARIAGQLRRLNRAMASPPASSQIK